jgi:hypothetical protein
MPLFRTVSAEQAGPGAVGILVPPGRRTVVVLRPRALDLDLLLLRRGDDGRALTAFHEAARTEAALLAENLGKALVRSPEAGSIEVIPAEGAGWLVQANFGAFALVACARLAGQAYRPLAFATEEEAGRAAAALRSALCPAADADQELYVNTQHFSR